MVISDVLQRIQHQHKGDRMTHRPDRLGEAGHQASWGRLGNSPHGSLTVEQMAPLGKGRCAAERLRDPQGEVQTSGHAEARRSRATGASRQWAGTWQRHKHLRCFHSIRPWWKTHQVPSWVGSVSFPNAPLRGAGTQQRLQFHSVLN